MNDDHMDIGQPSHEEPDPQYIEILLDDPDVIMGNGELRFEDPPPLAIDVPEVIIPFSHVQMSNEPLHIAQTLATVDPDVHMGNGEGNEPPDQRAMCHSPMVPIRWKRSGPFDHLGHEQKEAVDLLINSLSFTGGKKKRIKAPDGAFHQSLRACRFEQFLGSSVPPFDEAEFRAAVKEGYHYVFPICLCNGVTNEFLGFLKRNIDSKFDRENGRLVRKRNSSKSSLFTGVDRLGNFSMVLHTETCVICFGKMITA
jgi:hypothetical protein